MLGNYRNAPLGTTVEERKEFRINAKGKKGEEKAPAERKRRVGRSTNRLNRKAKDLREGREREKGGIFEQRKREKFEGKKYRRS